MSSPPKFDLAPTPMKVHSTHNHTIIGPHNHIVCRPMSLFCLLACISSMDINAFLVYIIQLIRPSYMVCVFSHFIVCII